MDDFAIETPSTSQAHFYPYLVINLNQSEDSTVACEASRSIHNSVVSLHLFNILLNVIGIIGTSIICVMLLVNKLYHINLRLLHANLCCMIIIRSITTVYRSSYTLLRISWAEDDCDLLWSLSHCRSLTELHTQPFICISYCYVALALERITASIIKKRYEINQNPLFGILAILAVIAELIACAVNNFEVAFISKDTSEDPISILYCNYFSIPDTPWYALLLSIRTFPVVLVAMIIFIAVYIHNRSELRLSNVTPTYSLSVRYQQKETYSATLLVVPCALIFLCCFTLDISLASLAMYLYSSSITGLTTTIILKECGTLMLGIYSVLHPLTIVLSSSSIRASLLCREYHIEAIPPPDISYHFDAITAVWDEFSRERSATTVSDAARHRLLPIVNDEIGMVDVHKLSDSSK